MLRDDEITIMSGTKNLLAKGYCKGALARTKNGARISPTDPLASNYCIIGALQTTYRSFYEKPTGSIGNDMEYQTLISKAVKCAITLYGVCSDLAWLNDFKLKDQQDALIFMNYAIQYWPEV